MLVLTRKSQQGIVLPNQKITIRVIEIAGKRVTIGIDAPPGVIILREELIHPSS